MTSDKGMTVSEHRVSISDGYVEVYPDGSGCIRGVGFDSARELRDALTQAIGEAEASGKPAAPVDPVALDINDVQYRLAVAQMKIAEHTAEMIGEGS